MTDFTGPVILRSSGAIPVIEPFDAVKKLWWFEDGNWAPKEFTDNLADIRISYLKLTNSDLDDDPVIAPLNLFAYTTVAKENGDGEPLLAVDKGFTVRKDISAGGFVCSNQGELWLGSGRANQLDVPKIILQNSGASILGGGGFLSMPPIPTGHSGSGSFPSGQQISTYFLRTDANEPYHNRVFRWDGSNWIDTTSANTAARQLFRSTDAIFGQAADTIFESHCSSGTWSWSQVGPASAYAGKYFDTLYLKKYASEDPAHLDLGNLTVHGDLTIEGQVALQLSLTVPGLTLDGDVTLSEGHSISPSVDCTSSIGVAGKMYQNMYTNNLIIGNHTAHSPYYITLADVNQGDQSGRILNFNTSSNTGAIIPDYENQTPNKTMNLGDQTHRWTNIYCNSLSANSISGITNFAVPGALSVGSGSAAISFTTGLTSGIRYLIPDGADKSVALGSFGHYLKYVDTDYLRADHLQHLDGTDWSLPWNGGTVTNQASFTAGITASIIKGTAAKQYANDQVFFGSGQTNFFADREVNNGQVIMGYGTPGAFGLQVYSNSNLALQVFEGGIWAPSANLAGTVLEGNWGSQISNCDATHSAIANDTSSLNCLAIVGNTSSGINRQVGIWDFLRVNGNQEITGTLLAHGDITSYSNITASGDLVTGAVVQFSSGNYVATRLAWVNNGCLAVQQYTDAGHSGSFNWDLSTLDCSNLKVDHFLGATGTLIYTWADIHPASNNMYNLGGSGTGGNPPYYGSLWASYIRYKNTPYSFDSLDDLALVKNYKTKTETQIDSVTKQQVDVEVVDVASSLPHLLDQYGFLDPSRDTGFLLGCAKSLALNQDAHEKRIRDLEEQIRKLTANRGD